MKWIVLISGDYNTVKWLIIIGGDYNTMKWLIIIGGDYNTMQWLIIIGGDYNIVSYNMSQLTMKFYQQVYYLLINNNYKLNLHK